MIDEQKFIGAQALLKSIIEKLEMPEQEKWAGTLRARFLAAIKIAEDYATIDPGEEWINTGVRVPKAYWDTRNEELIGEGNRPFKDPNGKGWFVSTQKKKIFEFKKMMDEREAQHGA